MKNRIRSRVVLVAALVLIVGLGVAVAFAENIDPFDTGDQHAWGENVGWLNAEPANCSDCGVEVSDTALTGYMWGENIGWVNMSCQNNSTCGTVNYGVTNDGAGNLAGYAWGENVGWISFDCSNTSSCGTVDYGVSIDGTGVFSGYAWGENIGWISFDCSNTSSCGTVNYGVVTSWGGDTDDDGVPDGSDNCPDDANPGQDNTDLDLGSALPPATFDGVPIGDSAGDICDDDDDDDGYSDTTEAGIGTTDVDNCTNNSSAGPGPNTDAFPSDMNKDDVVAINDITGPFAPHFGAVEFVDPTGTNPGDYNPRVDLNQDGVIAINDVTGPFAPDFGKVCT